MPLSFKNVKLRSKMITQNNKGWTGSSWTEPILERRDWKLNAILQNCSILISYPNVAFAFTLAFAPPAVALQLCSRTSWASSWFIGHCRNTTMKDYSHHVISHAFRWEWLMSSLCLRKTRGTNKIVETNCYIRSFGLTTMTAFSSKSMGDKTEPRFLHCCTSKLPCESNR